MDPHSIQSVEAIETLLNQIENQLLPEADGQFTNSQSYLAFRAYFKARVLRLRHQLDVSHIHQQEQVTESNRPKENTTQYDAIMRSNK